MQGITIYILRCSDGTYYTGITNNLARRLIEHLKGQCRYTRNRSPLYTIHTEKRPTYQEAAKLERHIKTIGAASYLSHIRMNARFRHY
jgi:predicted GIY-YIG superfamily endonuclease